MEAAILARNKDGFLSFFTEDSCTTAPGKAVYTPEEGAESWDPGFIDYEHYRRIIDYAGVRNTGEVLLIGEDQVRPRGPILIARRDVRRRFTDRW